jgi:hypothetical protein
MRVPALIRTLLLAVSLAASHAVYAKHMATHVSSSASNCEWCICQAQTLAGPLPAIEPPAAERCSVQPLLPSGIPFITAPAFCSCQPRAPPLSS